MEVVMMKALYVKTLLILLLTASSCGTGFYMASSYVDDAYYNPADQPVVVEKRVVVEKPVTEIREQVQDTIVAEAIEEELIMGDEREYVLVDSLSEQLIDEEGNVIVNNHYYYEPDEELEYSNRIYRFHRPGMSFGYYDMWYWDDWYWDSYWYSPYYYGGFSYYSNPWRYSYRYNPWYTSWYSPWYSSWYYPGYSSWYAGSYGYYGYDYYGYGKGWSAHKYNDNHHYGHRNSRVTDGIGMIPGGASKVQMAEARSSNSPRNINAGNKSLQTGTDQSVAQSRTSLNRTQAESKIAQTERGSSNRSGVTSYTQPRSTRSYARPPVRTSRDISTARSSQSTYVRPRSSGTTRSGSSDLRSSGNDSRSSSGLSNSSQTSRSSSAYRSSSSNYQSSGRSSNYISRGSSSTINRSSSSGSVGRSSGSSGSVSRSSGSSGISRSSGSSVSRSSGSSGSVSRSSSSTSSSSRSGGGGRR